VFPWLLLKKATAEEHSTDHAISGDAFSAHVAAAETNIVRGEECHQTNSGIFLPFPMKSWKS
jgi:hypothetical protein